VIDPQARDLPLDAHLHTDLSPDSEVPIDIYAAAAAERGIAELAITDHVDFDPHRPAYAYADFSTRERIAREAAERWADRGVAIRFGVELTYERAYEDDIREHLRRHAYDYTIGSVHIGVDSPYRRENVATLIAGSSVTDVVAPYFREVEAAARSGLFDTVGHLDFIKRRLVPHITPAMLLDRMDLYDPLLRALVDTGTGLEVNTSGLRQAAEETYPSGAVVARFRELGGERVTAGSDAHRPGWLAHGLEDGYRAVADAGFQALSFRRGGGPVTVPLPRRFA
jgi:histidinol-phosphatase (PHP family)